jgi:aryl-alcohol dehydrogenase-like predicted oxidoreductase
VLGTVQFGKEYGINNFSGKPTKEKSLEMLNLAFEKGIHLFDTAYEYGYAEEILGEFSKTNVIGEKIKIITKLKPNIFFEIVSIQMIKGLSSVPSSKHIHQ